MCDRKCDELPQALDYLELIFEKNHIDRREFKRSLLRWKNRKEGKKNTILFTGPSNSGKTLLANLICELFWHEDEWGYSFPDKNSEFMFEHFNGKKVYRFEELLVTPQNVDMLKCVLGGERLPIGVKYKSKMLLKPAPVIITTNRRLNKWIDPADYAALCSRLIMNFPLEFILPSINVNVCCCQLQFYLNKAS